MGFSSYAQLFLANTHQVLHVNPKGSAEWIMRLNKLDLAWVQNLIKLNLVWHTQSLFRGMLSHAVARQFVAAGVGLDFSSASNVIFAELPEEVAHVRQAEDRAHRKGQTQAVNVYFLIARGTIEERK